MLSALCLAVAAGVGVAALSRAPRQAWILAAGVCAIALVDGWIVAMPLGAPPGPLGIPTVAGARVLELPFDDDNVNVAAMYRETLHGLPVVNGYAGYVPPTAIVVDVALKRRDPSILTELRRGRPLYVVVANHPRAEEWTAFMDAQNEARMIGVSGAGRMYFMPAAPYPPQVTIGAPLPVVRGDGGGGWLTFDLGAVRTVRAVDVRTNGHILLVRTTVRVDTSLDGVTWTPVTEQGPGGLALIGALKQPLTIPLRVLLPDPSARYVRVNTPAFSPGAVTIYGPAI
jgi:hypothetical protein